MVCLRDIEFLTLDVFVGKWLMTLPIILLEFRSVVEECVYTLFVGDVFLI